MMITNICLAMSRHPTLEIFARHLAIARWRGLVWRGGEVGPTTLSFAPRAIRTTPHYIRTRNLEQIRKDTTVTTSE